MSETTAEPEILAERHGRLGLITLNRPKALNALSLGMVETLESLLAEWERDEAIDAVLIQGAGGRAFCAGGDVRSIGTIKDPAARERFGRAFFRSEYSVNHRINRYKKPFIALVGGIVMGGGMGLSIHGRYRIATETTVMAMPETVLGLFPDVGATWYLNRCPGRIGLYLAMTGTRLGPGDALWTGLATHYMPNAALDDLIGRLTDAPRLDNATIEAAIAANAGGAPSGLLATRQKGIEGAFAQETVEGVITQLQSVLSAGGDQTDWRVDALAVFRRASPIALRATWRRMRAGRSQSIEQVLSDDYRMAVRMVAGHDFAEGVRSILVDKDNAPRWNPADLGDLAEAAVDALLVPMPAGEDSRGLVAGDLTF